MTTITQNIAQQIKSYREEKGLTQKELAEMMSVQPTTITRIESGETGITSTVLEKFCQTTGQTISFQKADKKPSKVFMVCDYIISKMYKILGDDYYELTNLKLQKLLYYVQMEHLGKTGKPLFESSFVAWEHGPVIPEVYHKYKEERQIEPDRIIQPANLSKDEEDSINRVIQELGGASAWQLRNLTHEENPWKSSYQLQKNNLITEESIKSFYPYYLIKKQERTQYNITEIMPP